MIYFVLGDKYTCFLNYMNKFYILPYIHFTLLTPFLIKRNIPDIFNLIYILERNFIILFESEKKFITCSFQKILRQIFNSLFQ